MSNRQTFFCLGAFVNDVFISGVQEYSIEGDIPNFSVGDIGRASPFAQFELRPNISITLSRVITDVAPFFYQPAALTNYTSSFLLKNTNIGMCGNSGLKEYTLDLYYGEDNKSYLQGTPIGRHRSLYAIITGITYSFGVQGNLTENITFSTRNLSRTLSTSYSSLSLPETGRPIRRQHMLGEDASFLMPTEVSNTFDNGVSGAGRYALQDIEVSVSIDYSEISDSGKWRGSDVPADQNKWKYVNVPVQVSASYTGLARKPLNTDILVQDNNYSNVGAPNRSIRVVSKLLTNYYVVDLGEKNVLNNVSFLGADIGGNLTYRFTYSNSNNDFVPYIDSSIHAFTPVKF